MRLSFSGDEVVGDGEHGQLEAGGDSGFVEDVGQVAFDGFFAEAELLGDIAVGAAFDDAADDFHFAGGKAEGFAVGDGGLLHELVKSADEIDDAAASDPVIAAGDGANGGGDVLGDGILNNDAAGADLEGLDDLLGADGAGEQDDFDGGRAVHDGAHGFNAGEARHVDVEEEDVGEQLEGLGDGLIAVGAFADDFEALFALEHVAHADADDRMVVGKEDADGRGSGLSRSRG